MKFRPKTYLVILAVCALAWMPLRGDAESNPDCEIPAACVTEVGSCLFGHTAKDCADDPLLALTHRVNFLEDRLVALEESITEAAFRETRDLQLRMRGY